jgi:tripartite-type tricarboxylate transporter receptor subunit TctC
MAEDTFILWVHKDAGITTFEQFLEAAKAAGDKWVMGGTGKAQEDEMITAYLNSAFGLDMKYIPYKGGGEVAKELAGKQVNSTVNNPSEARGFYESGDVVPLVVFTPERLPNFPDVPTLKEKGKDFSYYMQRAVVGARGMSPEAAAYYQEVFKKLYDTQEWQDYMKKQSLVGTWLGAEETKAYWKEQRDRHEIILKAMGAM